LDTVLEEECLFFLDEFLPEVGFSTGLSAAVTSVVFSAAALAVSNPASLEASLKTKSPMAARAMPPRQALTGPISNMSLFILSAK
jgi:hypothetical protein